MVCGKPISLLPGLSKRFDSKCRIGSMLFLPLWVVVMILLLRITILFLLREWTLFFDVWQGGGALGLFAILMRVCSDLENVKGRLPCFVDVVGFVELFCSPLMRILASCVIRELDRQVVSAEDSSDDTFRGLSVALGWHSKLSLLGMSTVPSTAGFASAQISRIISGLSPANKCMLFIRNRPMLVSALNEGINMAALRFIASSSLVLGVFYEAKHGLLNLLLFANIGRSILVRQTEWSCFSQISP